MKYNIMLAFVSVGCLLAFVLIFVTMINTGNTSMLGWALATFFASLVSAGLLRWRYDRKR